MTVHLIYPDRTETATKEIVFTKRVLVVSPFVLLALILLLAAGAAWLVRRWRRKGPLREAPSVA